MLDWILNLQLFADGGDGGSDGGDASVAESSGEDSVLASIPEKARKYYKSPAKDSTPIAEEPSNTSTDVKPKYEDLIKSDDYKEEHHKYMERTINDRLKKYKGLEADNAKMLSALQTVGNKYGVDPTSATFLDDLASKIDEDDSYFENYAIEHDMSPAEARKIVTMERKVSQIEAERAEAERQEQNRQAIAILQQNAEKTKQRFPQFDLDTEMQNEKFRRLCAVNNGDTTSAYMACHWEQIMPNAINVASQQAQIQTANAISANKVRPIENGLSSTASSVVTQDFSKMDLKQIRAYAEEQRRKQGR